MEISNLGTFVIKDSKVSAFIENQIKQKSDLICADFNILVLTYLRKGNLKDESGERVVLAPPSLHFSSIFFWFVEISLLSNVIIWPAVKQVMF